MIEELVVVSLKYTVVKYWNSDTCIDLRLLRLPTLVQYQSVALLVADYSILKLEVFMPSFKRINSLVFFLKDHISL